MRLQGAVATGKPRPALRAKDPNVPSTSAAEAVPKRQPLGRSMSALLQSRSEAAAGPSTSAAHQQQRRLQPQSPMPDIDSADRKDPLAASEYVADIFGYYKRVEPQFRVSPNYMSRQVRAPSASYLCACRRLLQRCMR